MSRTPDPEAALRRLALLQTVTAALSRAVGEDDVARVIVEKGVEVLGAAGGTVLLVSADGASLDVLAASGYPAGVLAKFAPSFPVDDTTPAGRAVRTGQPVWIESNDHYDAAFPSTAGIKRSVGNEALAAIPVAVGDHTRGCIGFSFREAGPFAEADREFMVTLARQCAQALERSLLFERERSARSQLRFVLDSIDEVFYALDGEWRFADVNRHAERYFGRGRDDLIGRVMWEVFPQWKATDLEEMVRRVAASGRIEHVERESPVFAGRWFEAHVYPGEAGVFVFGRDITERKAAEAALHDSEERYRALAETIPQLLWSCDAGGQCVFLSRQWCDYTGVPAERHLGLGWLDAIHPDDRERARELWRAATADEGVYDLDYRLRHRDGAYRWFKTRGVPVRDRSGRITKWFGSCTDIDDRIRVEAALTEANRAKDEFLATVSHELRTPLNSIVGWISLLQSSPLDPATTRRAFDAIERGARAQATLIEDLLDVSRIIAGKLRLDVRPVPFASVVNDAVTSQRPAADAKGVAVEVEIEAGRDTVSGDPDRLRQIVWNLLSNAVKFTEPGGRVRVTLAERDSCVELVVADTGRGIDLDFLPYVFERFRQADSSITRQHGGLGLGLAIVSHLVEMHGGGIVAESEGPGRGASFVVRLPLATPADAPSDVPARSDARHEDAPSLRGTRVLLVDDDVSTLAVLGHAFTMGGADVTTATSVSEALACYEEARPDVLVSDVAMPGEDGMGLIARIRVREGSGRPVHAVAVTAFGRAEDRRRALDAGFDDFMTKPVLPRDVVGAVARAVASRKPSRTG